MLDDFNMFSANIWIFNEIWDEFGYARKRVWKFYIAHWLETVTVNVYVCLNCFTDNPQTCFLWEKAFNIYPFRVREWVSHWSYTLVSNTAVLIVFTVTTMTIWCHRKIWHFFFHSCSCITSRVHGIHIPYCWYPQFDAQLPNCCRFYIFLSTAFENSQHVIGKILVGWIFEEFYWAILILCPTKIVPPFCTSGFMELFSSILCNAFYTPIIDVDKMYCRKTSASFHGWPQPISIRYW